MRRQETTYDTLVAGGGLAGACSALVLSRARQRVLLVEAARPAAGASGAAAGLVNPFMARRARPVWRMDEALAALHAALDEAGAAHLFRTACPGPRSGGGVLRPARSEEQVRFFRKAAETHPTHAAWWTEADVQVRHPAVRAPHGALFVRSGGAVDVTAMIDALLEAARQNGAVVQTGARLAGWEETERAVVATLHIDGAPRPIEAGRLLLALGRGSMAFPELEALGLRGVKGQTVRLRRPDGLGEVPPLSGFGYVVPYDNMLVVGSSYEHTFDDLKPSPEQTRRIVEKAARMLPGLAEAEVLEERAGVRVYPPRGRRALLGPLPGRRRIWAFTGLGSRGLLTAPLVATGRLGDGVTGRES